MAENSGFFSLLQVLGIEKNLVRPSGVKRDVALPVAYSAYWYGVGDLVKHLAIIYQLNTNINPEECTAKYHHFMLINASKVFVLVKA